MPTNTPILPSPTPLSAAPSPTTAPDPTVIDVLPTDDLSLTSGTVFLYPVPKIYNGDLVSFQILANVPESVAADQVPVHIFVDGLQITSGTLGWRNLAGDTVGLFEWAWDTTGLIGKHTISIILDKDDLIQVGDENPNNNEILLSTEVFDAAQLSNADANATWVSAEIECCTVHVVSGTAAYRDLTDLLAEVEAAFQETTAKLGEPLSKKYDVYLIDRVIGQGGYAGAAMVVSYLDRNYAGDSLHEVLRHEAVHLIDRQFAPQRITFLAEGLAVWTSGGHYKQEDLEQRSKALLELGFYIPLPQLINDFYPVQHEIGYLEAAGFIDFLIDRYSWSQVRAFYTDVTHDDALTLAEAVDFNLQSHFGKSLADTEADWLAYLSGLPRDATAVSDLQTTVRFYNIMRRYQQLHDPTAYFLTAWLPYPQELETEGNPADLTRHPEAEINLALEVMLKSADTALRTGDYNRANILLDSIDRVLNNDGIFIDPLAVQFLNVVQTTSSEGYEIQQAQLIGNQAVVWATQRETAVLSQLNFTLQGRNWILSE
ncbi:MAG: hypothetical protein GY943_13150 [Chloroflexi bacterium]|nr:hypothetical protein [Chloroflexota bacterium]